MPVDGSRNLSRTKEASNSMAFGSTSGELAHQPAPERELDHPVELCGICLAVLLGGSLGYAPRRAPSPTLTHAVQAKSAVQSAPRIQWTPRFFGANIAVVGDADRRFVSSEGRSYAEGNQAECRVRSRALG
jgi:hypothetical protein